MPSVIGDVSRFYTIVKREQHQITQKHLLPRTQRNRLHPSPHGFKRTNRSWNSPLTSSFPKHYHHHHFPSNARRSAAIPAFIADFRLTSLSSNMESALFSVLLSGADAHIQSWKGRGTRPLQPIPLLHPACSIRCCREEPWCCAPPPPSTTFILTPISTNPIPGVARSE